MAARGGASMASIEGWRRQERHGRGGVLIEEADTLLRAIGVESQIAAEEPVDEDEIRLVDNLDHLATTELI